MRGEWDGFDRMLGHVRNLGSHPSSAVQARLRSGVASAFTESQALAHVSEGHMKAAGRLSSEYSALDRTFAGEISYDDPGAFFELRKGGEHSAFLDQIPVTIDDHFRDAIRQHFREA